MCIIRGRVWWRRENPHRQVASLLKINSYAQERLKFFTGQGRSMLPWTPDCMHVSKKIITRGYTAKDS